MDDVLTLGQYKGLTLVLDTSEGLLIATNTRTFLSCMIADAEDIKEIAPPLFRAWEIFNAGSPAMQEAGLTMKELNAGMARVDPTEAEKVQAEAQAKMEAGDSIETQPGVHIVSTKYGYVSVLDRDKADPKIQEIFENDFNRYREPNE